MPFDPSEERDQCDQAELWYNAPLRAANQRLIEELAKAKRLLRENGIPFPSAREVPKKTPAARVTRRSRRTIHLDDNRPLPTLPLEIQFIIVGYAMSSDHPIIDPLMPLDPSRITAVELKQAKNQFASGCLAACRIFQQEGSKAFWANNTFVFTTHQALRNLGVLDMSIRNTIRSTTLRIVAQYYDDRKGPRKYDSEVPGFPKVKIMPIHRVADPSTFGRTGFKSYTWFQVADFLNALRPPFDPLHDKKTIRPRLLPNLTSLRIDFVNFPSELLDFPTPEIHNIAAHHLCRTLGELFYTGLPPDESGLRTRLDLESMVRDDGLLIKGVVDTLVHHNGKMTEVNDKQVKTRVVRSWRSLVTERTGKVPQHQDSHWHGHRQIVPSSLGGPVPMETGHPVSLWENRPTMWKRVPVARDSSQREWVEFSRTTGNPVGKYYKIDDVDDFDDLECEDCHMMHEIHQDPDF